MKDRWDKFQSISTFISGVLIAAIGLFITLKYDIRQKKRDANLQEQQARTLEQQARTSELGTIKEYIPYLLGEDEDKKEAALLMIEQLASKQLALAVTTAYPKSKGIKKAGDIMMTSADQADLPPKILVPETPMGVEGSKKGWAYLGDFSFSSGKWDTRYLNFSINEKPEDLKDKIWKVRTEAGALNVREGMPTPSAEFLKVIDVLEAGSFVTIHEVSPWSSTGFMWARISYSP